MFFSGRKPLALRAAMRGTDEGDEHLNMKGAVCDLQRKPRAVHLQGMDPITQKQAIQTGNKTSSPGSLLLSDIQAPGSNHGSPYRPGAGDPGV